MAEEIAIVVFRGERGTLSSKYSRHSLSPSPRLPLILAGRRKLFFYFFYFFFFFFRGRERLADFAPISIFARDAETFVLGIPRTIRTIRGGGLSWSLSRWLSAVDERTERRDARRFSVVVGVPSSIRRSRRILRQSVVSFDVVVSTLFALSFRDNCHKRAIIVINPFATTLFRFVSCYCVSFASLFGEKQ